MKKTFKKLTCVALALTAAFASATTLTACETSHPEVEMKISFNEKTYTLNYKLYRKVAPATVEHFLYLVENGYYDGLCVHDYDEAAMYAGAYSASETSATELVYKKYYDVVKEYGKLPQSVWMDEEKSNPTYTLKGEFEDNNFQVTNGALKESFGSLTMYYYDISETTSADTDVYTLRASEEGKVSKGDYEHNMATSIFYISLSTTEKTNSGYCTFANLDKDSKSVLEDLQAAISSYITDNYSDEDDFTQDVTVSVLEDTPLFETHGLTEDFDTPKTPVVIEKMKVTKY